MKKSAKKTIEKVIIGTQNLEIPSNDSPKMKGRPVNQNSKRQQRIAELQAKREAGLLKKGRPIVEGSKRQQLLLEKEARKAANGGVVKRGRPKMDKVENASETK